MRTNSRSSCAWLATCLLPFATIVGASCSSSTASSATNTTVQIVSGTIKEVGTLTRQEIDDRKNKLIAELAPPPTSAASTPSSPPPPEPTPFELPAAAFELDSDKVDVKAQAWLLVGEALGDDAVKKLIAAGSWSIRVEGFTDDLGTVSHNLDLSQRRADAVKVLIVGLGYPQGSVTAAGMGVGGKGSENRKVLVRIVPAVGGNH